MVFRGIHEHTQFRTEVVPQASGIERLRESRYPPIVRRRNHRAFLEQHMQAFHKHCPSFRPEILQGSTYISQSRPSVHVPLRPRGYSPVLGLCTRNLEEPIHRTEKGTPRQVPCKISVLCCQRGGLPSPGLPRFLPLPSTSVCLERGRETLHILGDDRYRQRSRARVNGVGFFLRAGRREGGKKGSRWSRIFSIGMSSEDQVQMDKSTMEEGDSLPKSWSFSMRTIIWLTAILA